MVLWPRGPPADVVEPVVERAETGEEADRRGGERADDGDRLPVPDRVVAAEPAEEDDDAGAEQVEERGHPDRARPAGAEHPAAPAGPGRRRDVVGVWRMLGL